jgi:Ca2+-binding RTX toxin-like protein
MIDMRSLGAVLLLLITSFFAMTAPTMAQSSLRVCPGVDLTGPADGAVLDPSYRTNFTWDSEPRGTASREWVSVRVDLDETSFSFEDAKKAKAERRLYKGFARGRPGIYAWAVIFYDAKGNPICQSEARTYVVIGAGFASLSGTSDGAIAAIKAALGRYVVRLTGGGAGDIAYNGPVNEDVAGFIYVDGFSNTVDWQAKGYDGLDVHGTNKPDIILGSNKGDRLYGHEGNDIIAGFDGDDRIEGGNEFCLAGGCVAGDLLVGDQGNDTIIGGDETCLALGGCIAGDVILGGDGIDTISGGNETCAAFGSCSAGDAIDGNAGPDIITGGTESCASFGACNQSDVITADVTDTVTP